MSFDEKAARLRGFLISGNKGIDQREVTITGVPMPTRSNRSLMS